LLPGRAPYGLWTVVFTFRVEHEGALYGLEMATGSRWRWLQA
jgi:hypothetical protein